MNDILKTIYERRAVRKYKPDAVSKELINQIIDAGRMAPSAINHQPWKFYVVTKKELIKLLSKDIRKRLVHQPPHFSWRDALRAVTSFTNLAHGIEFMMEEDPIFHGAPTVIFITAPKNNEWAALDIGMCSENMMLAAQSLGVNSCPVGLGVVAEGSEHFSVLDIPKDEHIHLALIFGYGSEVPEVKERKKDNVQFIE